jgi:hypothetical protein
VRQQVEKSREDHPFVFYPSEFAGAAAQAAVLPGGPAGKGLLNTLGRVAVRGALPGAVAGVGYGTAETPEGMATEAGVGGALGTALYGPAALVGRGVQWVGDQGKKMLGRALDRISGRINTEAQGAYDAALKTATSAADKESAAAQAEYQKSLAAHGKDAKAAEAEYQRAQAQYQRDVGAAQKASEARAAEVRQRILDQKTADEKAAQDAIRPQAEKDAAQYLMEAEAKKAASAPPVHNHSAENPADIEARVAGRWAQAHQDVAHRLATAQALGVDLEQLAKDAPPGVADDVGAIIDKVRERYAANSLKHLIQDPDEVAAAFRKQLEAEMNFALAGKGPAARAAATKVGVPSADTLVAERLAAPPPAPTPAPAQVPEPTSTTIARPLQAPPKPRAPAKAEPTQNLRVTPAQAQPSRATPLPAEPTEIGYPPPPVKRAVQPPPVKPVDPTLILPPKPHLVPEGEAALADPRVQLAIEQGRRELKRAIGVGAAGGGVVGTVFGGPHGAAAGAAVGAGREVLRKAMRSDPAMAAIGQKLSRLAEVNPEKWGSVLAFLGRSAAPEEVLVRVHLLAEKDPDVRAAVADATPPPGEPAPF